MVRPEDTDRTWDQYYADRPSLRQHLANLSAHSPLLEAAVSGGAKRVLEVGVGTGTMSLFLASLGYEVVGVDNDAALLDRARKAASAVNGVEYVLADAFDLTSSFAAGSFDAVFSQGFFEHFSDDDVRRALDQQLAVGRHVAFSVPSWYYRNRDMGNERLLFARKWRRILAGYDASVRYYAHFPHTHIRPMHILALVRGSSA